MTCECHERDSSYTCKYCKAKGMFGHMEDHLEKEWNEQRQKEAKEYNQKIAEFRHLPESTGCIGALACEHCGEINYGTCLCMGVFTCSECEEDNNIWEVPQVDDILQAPVNLSARGTSLEALIKEAKEIIDHPDGYDMMFDFVLGIAGLDGDPEYQ